jgi:hypothetical protein
MHRIRLLFMKGSFLLLKTQKKMKLYAIFFSRIGNLFNIFYIELDITNWRVTQFQFIDSQRYNN